MTKETDNTALVRRFIDEVFVARREDAVEELLHEDFVGHTWGPQPVPREFLHGAIERVNAGLSDVSMTIEDTVAAGDRVAVRLTSRARHTGELMGMPATGHRYEIDEMHLFRIADGRIAEHWHVADLAGMYRQLGVTPPAPTASTTATTAAGG